MTLNRFKTRHLFTVGAETRRQRTALSDLNWEGIQKVNTKFFIALCMSTNDHKSIKSINFMVSQKLYQVDGFVNIESIHVKNSKKSWEEDMSLRIIKDGISDDGISTLEREKITSVSFMK